MCLPSYCQAIIANTEEINSSNYFNAVGGKTIGGGKITVYFSVTGTDTMSQLGATKIYIKNSSGTTVRSYYSYSTPSMMGHNVEYYEGSVTYNGAISGQMYNAVIYYKAANSSGSETRSFTTGYATA